MPHLDLDRIQSALTTKYWSLTYWTDRECPPTLIEALTNGLNHLKPESWPERFAFGGIFVNGQEALVDMNLCAPCRIEYYEPKFPLSDAFKYFPSFSRDQILYEDEEIIALYKPAHLPSLPARDQRVYSLKRQVDQELSLNIHMPSRLDMSAQGVIVASKTPRMHLPLQSLYAYRIIKKLYILEGSAPAPWSNYTASGAIGKDLRHPILRKVVESGGKAATTIFTNLSSSSCTSLDGQSYPTTILAAQPLTGRTHQIRVHAAHANLPIVGDNFYGGLVHSGLHLLSFRARFRHPFNGKQIDIALPQKFAPTWLDFDGVCSEIKKGLGS